MAHYLDHAATTPVRPGAVEAMLPVLTETYGNPSGAHRMARAANHLLDDARDTMATALGAEPGQIVFTGGGTEADSLAIRGTLDAAGGVAVCTAIEHHAVLDPIEYVGGRVVPVAPNGVIDLNALADALDESVTLVSVMLANNETGVIQPLDEVATVVREHAPAAVLHTDAVQALCWLDVAALAAEADLVSVSAHKFGGPKGVGALVVRDRAVLSPLLRGGGQERDRRGGTQNVPGIVAMATAAAETLAERPTAVPRVSALRDRLADGIRDAVDGVTESGVADRDRRHKTANLCHLCFAGVESEALLFLLERQEIMASAASSCASGAMDPSHVLAAMGVDRRLAAGSLRLSLGYSTTDADVDAALAAVPAAVGQIRAAG
ncbi:MAG: cysteine desulfurase family protein [Actinomycetota bacterium]